MVAKSILLETVIRQKLNYISLSDKVIRQLGDKKQL